jgi:hypothetical protein
VYDSRLDAWRIFWIDPATNVSRQQIGKASAGDGASWHLQVEVFARRV